MTVTRKMNTTKNSSCYPSSPPKQTPQMSSTTSVFRNFDEYRDGDCSDGHEQSKRTSATTSSAPSSSSTPDYEFTFKHQYSIQNNPLCGIEFPQWVSILKRRHKDIEYTVYWPRLIFISIMSIFNYVMGTIERYWYDQQISQATPNPRPVFILGHPRTGTTLLHSLIALDSTQFTYCSTFCAGFPSCFLWFEQYGKQLLKGVIGETRPMDNVKLHFDLPQEDELATCVLSGGVSPYMPLYFMTQERQFRPFYAFDDNNDTDNDNSSGSFTSQKNDELIDDPSIMAETRNKWINSFMYLIRKLTVRDEHELLGTRQLNGQRIHHHRQRNRHPRRLVLKSPVHTARIRLLDQLFPDAQYIYIHRHPYDVLRSAIHMADTTYWYTYLSRPTSEQIMEFILRQYEILYDRYIEGRDLLLLEQQQQHENNNKRRIVEVSFDELSSTPIETMQRIYEELGWEFSSEYKTCLQNEVGDVKSYQRNVHRPLPLKLKRIVNERWRPSFKMFGYTMDE